MKKILITLLLSNLLLFCTKNNTSNINIPMENTKEIPQNKQINYILDLTLKTPYEIFIDDIKIASNYSRGSNAAVELNPYLLKNGKYKIKLKLLPFWQHQETTIDKDEIKNSRLLFGYYIKDRSTGKVSEYITDTPLKIKTSSNPVPFLEQEWEIDITNLPYELEGWSDGQDLRKLDQEILGKKVVSFYKNLWHLLNDGNAEKYQQLWVAADKELMKYNYESTESYQKAESNNLTDLKKCENMMIPLEDYEMKIYAEGKLVTLERKSNTKEFNNEPSLDIKGWSPLIRKYKISGGAAYGVKLYLPKDSNEFVIIRK